MPTEKKERQVEELKDRFNRCVIAIATDYTGLTANALTELRKRLNEQGVEYRVVKNSLAYIAADGANRPEIKEIVNGPTALAFGYDDPIEVAKALETYIRSTRSILSMKGAALDGRTIGAAEVLTLAQLPPKPQLIARLLGQMQAPASGFLTVLNGPIVGLATLLQRRVEQLQAESQ